MKKVININFQGMVIPIEETSYELLKEYIESLRQYFVKEEGRNEIINDIESRIGELFQDRLKKGATCITDDDVNAIIKNIGRPQDFEEEEGSDPSSADSAKSDESKQAYYQPNWEFRGKRLYRDENNKILGGVCSGIAAYFNIDPVIVRILFIVSGIGFFVYILLWIFVPGSNSLVNGVRRRLYRNPDGKILGGVCSGIGSYFDVNPWLIRFLFLIPFITFIFRWGHVGALTFPHFISFTFSPGTFLIYIILWLVIPEAVTTSEKLEMKGEKVDINSIKNSVVAEMKGVKERVGKMGAEAGNFAKEKGAQMGQEMRYAARSTGSVFGNVIVTIFKIFSYFILGSIAFALIVALFSIAVVSVGVFPLKDFILTNGWQSAYAWGTLIFFIGVPVVGLITFIIRRLARIKSTNRMIRYSFVGLWILGVICFIALIASIANDFRRISSMNEQKIALTNASVPFLTVSSIDNNRYHRYNNWLRFEPFAYFDDDTAYVSNVHIRIEKSPTDSFQVGVIKMCNGSTRRDADNLASLINFKTFQTDSALMIDRAIAINTTDKFRNQYVELTVYVPVNHKIKIEKNVTDNPIRFYGPWWHDDSWDNWYGDNDYDYDFKYGETYIMKQDGLYTLDGIPSNKENEYRGNREDEYDENMPTNPGSYRYNKPDKIDSLIDQKQLQRQKAQMSIDSLREERQRADQRLKDSLNGVKEKIEQKIQKIDDQDKPPSQAYIRVGNGEYNFVMHI